MIKTELPSTRIKLPIYDENWEETLKKKLFEGEEELQRLLAEEAEKDNKDGWAHHARPGEEWDVPLSEEIKYFDPELSYELTGYRPITMEKGLDFDPTPFCEVGQTFERTGKYTEYPPGGKLFRDFWHEQTDRCINGYTVGKYRITGVHYFFLNFYRMKTVSGMNGVGTGRNESFPQFLAIQYLWYHYREMCALLVKDSVALKGRGTGWSEMTANEAVCNYTTRRGYRSLLTCEAETKLDPLRDKCWFQLNFLDMKTNGGFKHIRQVKNNYTTKRASQLTKANEEYGWMSEIDSIVADTPDKVRGDRCDLLVFEEAGSAKYLLKAWIQGDSLVTLGGKKIACKVALGTGGDSEHIEGLSKLFTKPDAFNILPFKNYDTDDGKPLLTGFFAPSHKFALMPEYLDERGVTDCKRFKEFYQKQRNKLEGQALVDESAEHCFTPTEALMKKGENQFDSVALSERLLALKVMNAGTKPRPITLLWDRARGNGMEYLTVHNNPNSKLFIVEEPLRDADGNGYDNLYVGGIDSIDQGTVDSASNYDVSDFCCVILKRMKGLEEPRIVAYYKDRPKDIREAYDTTLKLLVWYKAKAVLEYTKISIIRHFEERKMTKLFMDRPDFAYTGSKTTRTGKVKRLIGVPSTKAVIDHGLELVANFVQDYAHTIDFEEILQQLLNYSYEDKRKYDIVAALQMVMIGDEQLTGVIPREVGKMKKEWKDIGYYTDENGVKRYGVIPKKRCY